MGEPITIIVPGTPVPKGRPRFGTGRAFTPKKTKDYEQTVGWEARIVMRGRKPILGAVELYVVAYVAPPPSWSKAEREQALRGLRRPVSKPDGDNYLKIAMDAISGIIWKDDCQVTDMLCRKRFHAEPHLLILVKEIEIADLLKGERKP